MQEKGIVDLKSTDFAATQGAEHGAVDDAPTPRACCHWDVRGGGRGMPGMETYEHVICTDREPSRYGRW